MTNGNPIPSPPIYIPPGVDWNDPCVRADALRRAYYMLLTGASVSQISYSDGNQQRSVSYSNKTVDLDRLRAELQAAEEECTGIVSATGHRQAFVGGALRRCGC